MRHDGTTYGDRWQAMSGDARARAAMRARDWQAWQDRRGRRRARVRRVATWAAVATVAVVGAQWLAGAVVESVEREAHGATVRHAVPGRGEVCVTVDTGRNVARMGARRYRYRDMGDGIRWQAGTPAQVRALARAGMAARRAAEPIGRPSTVATCTTWTDRGMA